MMLWHWGEEYLPTNKMTYGIVADSLAQNIGLKTGDKILSVDGNYVEKFRTIPLHVILHKAKTIEVNRDGQNLTIPIPDDFRGKLIHYKDLYFISERMPFPAIGEVLDTSIAARAGLKKGDKIISVDGNPITFFDDFKNQVQPNKGKNIAITYLRSNDTLHTNLQVPETGMIGIANVDPTTLLPYKEVKYGFFESIPAGLRKCVETLESYWLQLKLIFSGEVKTSESLGSVISIGNMYGSKIDWSNFWSLTAFFSLVLALMNILPIPALDGGHALFTIVEIITRRKPSEKFMEYAQMAGMVLLLGLMAYALGLDFMRIFK